MTDRKIDDIYEFEYRGHDVAIVMHNHLDAKNGIHIYVDGDDKTWDWFSKDMPVSSGEDGRVVTNGAIISIVQAHIDKMENKTTTVKQEKNARKFEISPATPDES